MLFLSADPGLQADKREVFSYTAADNCKSLIFMKIHKVCLKRKFKKSRIYYVEISVCRDCVKFTVDIFSILKVMKFLTRILVWLKCIYV